MFSHRFLIGVCATLIGLGVLLVHGQGATVIIRGKVTLTDGSPPPKPTGIQRICDDIMGSAPGPLTDNKGEYVWRMEVDPMRTRKCTLEATLAGYASSGINISNLNGYLSTLLDVPPIVISLKLDPRVLNTGDNDVPSKSKTAWKAAVKVLDTNLAEAAKQFQEAAEASPKFARGWHSLGVVYENIGLWEQAQNAYRKAIEADPKSFASYVTLAGLQVRAKDWQGALKTAETLMKLDTKQPYREIYLYHAIARFRLKDLDGAEASAKETIRSNQKQKFVRGEWVLGRIALARGDMDGAREHISKYIQLEPDAADIAQIKSFLQSIGKPEGAALDPPLEQQ